MNKPTYESSVVCSAVAAKHPGKKQKKIIDAIDEYARSSRGQKAAENIMLCGGPSDMDTFKTGALRHVKQEVYGNVIALAVWFFIKPLVLSIIASFIESMLMQERK